MVTNPRDRYGTVGRDGRGPVVSRLVFTKNPYHRYSLDGKRVPSVTGIINKAIAKPALLRWAAKATAEWSLAHASEIGAMGEGSWVATATSASDRVRDESATVGKQVHSIAERLVYGEPVETEDPDTGEPYRDDVLRMGERVAEFMDRWDVTADTAVVEASVFHDEYRYAGTFDLLAHLRGGARWLIDYKTGASGIYPETSLQLAAYAHASHIQIGDRDLVMPPVDRCAALWVRPDAWELIPVPFGQDQWRIFTACMAIARWTSLPIETSVGAPLPIPEGENA